MLLLLLLFLLYCMFYLSLFVWAKARINRIAIRVEFIVRLSVGMCVLIKVDFEFFCFCFCCNLWCWCSCCPSFTWWWRQCICVQVFYLYKLVKLLSLFDWIDSSCSFVFLIQLYNLIYCLLLYCRNQIYIYVILTELLTDLIYFL